MFDNSFPACAFFFLFFEVEISLHTLILLFRPGSVHSGSASWNDRDWVFPDDLRVSSFPDRFPHYACATAESAHSDFVGSKVYACQGVTCHLYFWQNDRGLLRATAVTRESAHKVDSGEENSPAAPARIRTRNLLITSPELLPTSYPGSPSEIYVHDYMQGKTDDDWILMKDRTALDKFTVA